MDEGGGWGKEKRRWEEFLEGKRKGREDMQ